MKLTQLLGLTLLAGAFSLSAGAVVLSTPTGNVTCSTNGLASCSATGEVFCKTVAYCEKESQKPVCLATQGENGSTVMKPFCKGKRLRDAPVLCSNQAMPTCDAEGKVVCGQPLPQ